MSAYTAGFTPLSGFWNRSKSVEPQNEDSQDTQESLALVTTPRVDRVRMAFKEIPLNQGEERALSALIKAPGSSAQELSATCGWLASGWQTQMLLLCQRRRHYLWPGGMTADMTNGLIITALAQYNSETLSFRPRPELTAILKSALAKT